MTGRGTRRCGVDKMGRSACAELLRYQLDLPADTHITTTIPAEVDVAHGYRCTHGVTYWVENADAPC